MKKEFTNKIAKEYSEKSDVELVELLEKGTLTPAKQDTIKAILDMRLKKVINHLKDVTEKSANTSSNHNKVLIALTLVLTALTIVLVLQAQS